MPDSGAPRVLRGMCCQMRLLHAPEEAGSEGKPYVSHTHSLRLQAKLSTPVPGPQAPLPHTQRMGVLVLCKVKVGGASNLLSTVLTCAAAKVGVGTVGKGGRAPLP